MNTEKLCTVALTKESDEACKKAQKLEAAAKESMEKIAAEAEQVLQQVSIDRARAEQTMQKATEEQQNSNKVLEEATKGFLHECRFERETE